MTMSFIFIVIISSLMCLNQNFERLYLLTFIQPNLEMKIVWRFL